MTDICLPAAGRPVRGVQRQKKQEVKTDMTPMVDLGFLLITFFVITAELSRPNELTLAMPKDGRPTPLGESNSLTVLIRDRKHIYYYPGGWKEAVGLQAVRPTSLSEYGGLGQLIRDKQLWLDKTNQRQKRNGLMLLIKSGKEAPYQAVMDALDEALINKVARYVLLPADGQETKWMYEQD